MKKLLATTLFLLIASFGCSTLAISAEALNTPLQQLKLASQWPEQSAENGQALSPTPFLNGQKHRQSTDTVSSLTLAPCLNASPASGSYPNKLPLSTTSLLVWHYYEQPTEKYSQATLAMQTGLNRQINF